MILTLALVAATAVAPPAPAPTPQPETAQKKPALRGGFGTPPDAVRSGSGTLTVESAPPRSSTAGSASPPAATAPRVPSGVPAAGAGSEAERAWRGRLANAQAALASAEAELRRVEAEAVVTTAPGGAPPSSNGQPYGTPLNPDSTIARAAREKATEPYRARVAEAKQGVEAVREDCRRTEGCMPAWVR